MKTFALKLRDEEAQRQYSYRKNATLGTLAVGAVIALCVALDALNSRDTNSKEESSSKDDLRDFFESNDNNSTSCFDDTTIVINEPKIKVLVVDSSVSSSAADESVSQVIQAMTAAQILGVLSWPPVEKKVAKLALVRGIPLQKMKRMLVREAKSKGFTKQELVSHVMSLVPKKPQPLSSSSSLSIKQ